MPHPIPRLAPVTIAVLSLRSGKVGIIIVDPFRFNRSQRSENREQNEGIPASNFQVLFCQINILFPNISCFNSEKGHPFPAFGS